MERYHAKNVRSSHSRRAGYRLLHADSNRTFLAGNTGTTDDYAPFQKQLVEGSNELRGTSPSCGGLVRRRCSGPASISEVGTRHP